MQKRWYSLILIVFLLASCVHAPKNPPATEQAFKTEQQIRPLSAFNKVDIQGQINVNLHTGYKQPQVILRGDTRDLAAIKTNVLGNTLYLVVGGKGSPQFGPVYADVRGQFLNRIAARNAGTIVGNQLRTSMLDVYLIDTNTIRLDGSIGLHVLDIQGNTLTQISGVYSQNLRVRLIGKPKVQLFGVANLTNLTLEGSPSFNFYWVKTDTLTIRAREGANIQLAGAVNRLDVELWGNARFKGRYLRAQRSFVKTHGHSVAEISVANHQSNLATDFSDIYFYNLPNTRADFMAFDGSVLDMREWNRVEMEDYTRYNKQFP